MSTELSNQTSTGTNEDRAPEDAAFDLPPTPEPSPALRALDRLVGRWAVSGGAEGTVSYEWMEGGYFLLQRVHLAQFGQAVEGLEIIGNLRPFGEHPSADVHSRFYDNTGNTLDYVYEIEGDTLRIWAGEKGSPAYYTGTFDDGDRTVSGSWVYPGGGGYESTMTRVHD
ncbi:hypothetical protein [Intrasporangium sp.]|uniref:hypothetical protein n=1 Tax=Intrasporangium sp. TaxID=1925024 RepID=UPI0029396474|nr:hypothetical protein [Intrasporangium sp.]MDV3222293.1 hypothetical protein [Intrasporangium sp.]